MTSHRLAFRQLNEPHSLTRINISPSGVSSSIQKCIASGKLKHDQHHPKRYSRLIHHSKMDWNFNVYVTKLVLVTS